jgi:hypothetical protein
MVGQLREARSQMPEAVFCATRNVLNGFLCLSTRFLVQTGYVGLTGNN